MSEPSSSLGREEKLICRICPKPRCTGLKPEPKTATLAWRWSAPVASNSAAGSERDREKYRDHPRRERKRRSKHKILKRQRRCENEGCRAITRQPYITEPDPILSHRILPDPRDLELPIPHECVLRRHSLSREYRVRPLNFANVYTNLRRGSAGRRKRPGIRVGLTQKCSRGDSSISHNIIQR